MSRKNPSSGVSLYKTSGVDIHKGDALVDWLVKDQKPEKLSLKSSLGAQLDGIGSFAGLFRPNLKGFKDPVLVSGTDGVGTKLLLALSAKKLAGVGIDLVAMCVNDLYCVGARPLFFIDYYATGVLDSNQFKHVLSGIRQGLKQSDAILLGGETAELPGLYAKGHFDLGGFVVGIVDFPKRLGPHLVKSGDRLVGLASSGFHSNGYSLIRHWIKKKKVSKDLLSKILTPTKIYSEIPEILEKFGTKDFHALAHITGGGISGNLPRVIPQNLACKINVENIPTPKWMSDFFKLHGKTPIEMETVFNLGIGMIAVVSKQKAEKFVEAASKLNLKPVVLGYVTEKKTKEEVIFI